MTEEEFVELEEQFTFRSTKKFCGNDVLHDVVYNIGVCITRGFYQHCRPSSYEIVNTEIPPMFFSCEEFEILNKNRVKIIWNTDQTLSFRNQQDLVMAMLLQ